VIEAMPGASAPTMPIVLIIQATPVAMIKADSVVTLVRIVKSMRELGCEPFLGEPDAKIAEDGFVQLKMPWIRCR